MAHPLLRPYLSRGALLFGLLGGVALLPETACAEKKGGLFLAVTTDMRAPKDVNVISVAIQINNEVKYNFVGRVTPEGEVLLPATLAIAEPDDPAAAIRIRVIAFKDTAPRVLRDVTTTSPRAGRIALLRMPLLFVNDGSARGALPEANVPLKQQTFGGALPLSPQTLKPAAEPFNPFGAEVFSACSELDETMIDGECRSAVVDSSKLPDYHDELVSPSDGRCFDPKACIVNWRDAEVDLDACKAPKNGAVTNVTFVTSSTGDCDAQGRCLVPVDRVDPLDEQASGWHEEGDAIVLSKGICKKLRAGVELGFVGDLSCPTKDGTRPVCVGPTNPAIEDAGSDSGDAGALPTAEKVIGADLASGLAVFDDRIYVAKTDGIHVLPTNGTPTLVGGSPTGPFAAPWFASQLGSDVVFAEGSLIQDVSATRAWVMRSPATTLAPLNLLNAVGGSVRAVAMAPAAWIGVAGGVAGSAYREVGADAFGVLASSIDVSAVALSGSADLLIGTPTGDVNVCDAQGASAVACSSTTPTTTSTSVDVISTHATTLGQAFVLKPDGVFLFTTGATPKISRLTTADLTGVTDGAYFPLGMVALAKCAVFGSKEGLRFVTSDGITSGLLAAFPSNHPIVAAAVPPRAVANPPEHVYFVVRAAEVDGGGVYRVPVPAGCF